MSIEEAASRTPTVMTQSIALLNRTPEEGAAPAPQGQLLREAYGGPAVSGVLEVVDVAWLQVLRMTAARHCLVHRPSGDAGPSIALSLQVRGTSIIEQEGRSTRLVPGRWSLFSPHQPYTFASAGQTQRLVLIMPSERIAPALDLNALITRSFSGTGGLARVAFEAARSVVENPAALKTMPVVELAESVCRLASLALHEGATRPPPAGDRDTLVDRIHSYINDHLRDPELRLDHIARSLNASKRSLHRAAHQVGCSIHNLIWHTRLDRCRSDLLDPAKRHLPIADIAESWGFKNMTHFSRAFRDRFGVSAREVRRHVKETVAG